MCRGQGQKRNVSGMVAAIVEPETDMAIDN